MKIAFVRKKYNPYGGAERYLNLLSGYLVRGGHEVHIFANQWPSGSSREAILHRIPMIKGLSILKVWSFAIAAWFKLKKYQGDIIFSNERLFSQDIFRASDGVHRTWLRIRMQHVSLLKRISLLINPLHWTVRFFDWYIFTRHAYRKIIAPSEFIKQDILDTYQNVQPDDIRVIYNGVDLERFNPQNKTRYRDEIRKELGIPSKAWLLLFAGTGFERKGLKFAVESLRYLPSDTFLVVIGKGSLRSYRSLSQQYDLSDRIRFIGPVEGAEPYFASSDILIAPALYEPMANVILESLATGIPVVTSRHCGNSEIISDGVDGWIIEQPDDPKRLSLKIMEAMKRARKPETEIRAREKACRFTFDRTISDIMDVILTQ